MRTLSYTPFCSYDGWWVSLWYLSAGLRYTTRLVASLLSLLLLYEAVGCIGCRVVFPIWMGVPASHLRPIRAQAHSCTTTEKRTRVESRNGHLERPRNDT